MISPAYCQVMARYAHWMNERLHALLAGLADEERRRDRGAFFGSMHETCNHLLWGDRTWLGRFTGEPFTAVDFGRGLFADFGELRRERSATDQRMLQWAAQVSPAWLAGSLRYRSASDGKERELPAAIAAVHLFNHGTHHRGQLTTLVRQAGHDPGVTDLPWLPGTAGTGH